MNTYIKTILDAFGNQLFPRTRVDAVYLEDNTTTLDTHLDSVGTSLNTLGVDVEILEIAQKIRDNNLVPNGDFSNGMTEFTLNTAFDKLVLVDSDYGKSLNVAKTTGSGMAYKNVLGMTQVTYYSIGVKLINAPIGSLFSCTLYNDAFSGVGSFIANNLIVGTWQRISYVSNNVSATRIGILSSNGNESIIDNITAINLTTIFGAGNEPTKEQVDSAMELLGGWTDQPNNLKYLSSYNLGSSINALTAKAIPVDADVLALGDSASTFATKKYTWANLKSVLKTYFDTLYPPKASPALTGTPTAPTAVVGTNTTQIATTAFIQQEVALLAPKANPTFTGTVTAPTIITNQVSVRSSTTPNKQIAMAVNDTLDTYTIDAVHQGVAFKTLSLNTNGDVAVRGIKFPATQVPSSNPNTLDDYEEGTWTPTINTTTKTYTTQYGNYTKVGNVVTVSFNLVFTNTTSGTGDLELGGLPFAVSNKNSNLRASGVISYNNLGSSIYALYTQSGLVHLLISNGNAFLNRSAVGVAAIVIMGTITYETL